jgi:hypothetical protein
MACIRSIIIARHAAAVTARSATAPTDAALPFQLFHSPGVHALFHVVYLVCKTRGYKHIVKLLPHEVADLEPALQLLLSQDRSDHMTWETRYVLFLWLSILVLVPFDLATADSMATLTGGYPACAIVRCPPGVGSCCYRPYFCHTVATATAPATAATVAAANQMLQMLLLLQLLLPLPQCSHACALVTSRYEGVSGGGEGTPCSACV